MRIGYPCINRTLNCRSNKTFRIKNYSNENALNTASDNVACLEKIIHYNIVNKLFFFRITSNLIPFGSHPLCSAPWQNTLADKFATIGTILQQHKMRVSMHPGHHTIINSINPEVVTNAIRDLTYHAKILDLLGTDQSAKIQIHIGGVYGNKEKSIKRFIKKYRQLLPDHIKKILVIENDEFSYTLSDCLNLYQELGIPIVLDTLHHELNNNGEPLEFAIELAQKTWTIQDGPLMIDYSTQDPDKKRGAHAQHLNHYHFVSFLKAVGTTPCDVMLELKDKELSAQKALEIIERIK